MAVAPADMTAQRRRSGFRLLTTGLCLWLGAMMAIHVTIARSEGYGLGIGDGGRVPPAIVAEAGVGACAANVVRATSEHVGPVGAGETLWRVLVSVAALVAIVVFWFVIISRIGVF